MAKINIQDGIPMTSTSESGEVAACIGIGNQGIMCENEENYFEGISETETSELDLDVEKEEEEDELQKAIESILELEEIREQEDPNGATGKETLYKCDICRKNVNVKMLERHMNNHKKREQRGELKCKFCGRRFVKRHIMYRHEMSHRQNIYLCQECGRPFYRKDVYEVHVRTHTGEKPHQCPICKNRYNDPSNLRKHMYCHETHKNYKCDLCDEDFNTYGTWKKHHRLHAGLENFNCSVCSKVFFRWEKLKDHEISVHNITTRERQTEKRKSTPRAKKSKPTKRTDQKVKKGHEQAKTANTRSSKNKNDKKCSGHSKRSKIKSKSSKLGEKPEKGAEKCNVAVVTANSAENSCGTDKENKEEELIIISIPSPSGNESPIIDLEDMNTVMEEQILEPLSPIHVGPYENIEIEDVTDENEVFLPLSPIPIATIPFTCPICGEEFESQDNWETHFILAHGDNRAEGQLLQETLTPLTAESFTCWICGVEIRVDSAESATKSATQEISPLFQTLLSFQGALKECPKCKSAKTTKKPAQ